MELSTTVVQQYITDKETDILNKLLGDALALLFIADLVSGVPQTARFLAIFNAFTDGENRKQSLGIKKILQAQVFYWIIYDDIIKHSQSGVVTGSAENSIVQVGGDATRLGESRWNEVLQSWKDIQWYINDNSGTYPEYDGQPCHPKYSALL